jgi:hypothetical protein
MLPDEALSPGGCEHSIFTAKVATALERIPDAVQARALGGYFGTTSGWETAHSVSFSTHSRE